MSWVMIYATGICAASVCAPVGMSHAEIEELVNEQSPTGIPSPWKISDDESFADGTPCGSPCEARPTTRQHWLVNC